MNVLLLYEEKDWMHVENYYDTKSLIQDLGLKTLFTAAAKDVVSENGAVKYVKKEDTYLADSMKKVMMVPLTDEQQLQYRQEILRDCFQREGFVCELYDQTVAILEKWDKLGRKASDRTANRSPVALLINDIQVLKLFVTGLGQIKRTLGEHQMRLNSRGFLNLYDRLREEFSDEREAKLSKILEDISFYTDLEDEEDERHNTSLVNMPRIVLQCGVGSGLKFDELKVEEISTELRMYRNPGGTFAKIYDYINTLSSDSFSILKSADLKEDAASLEFQVVSYIVASCAPFMSSFNRFFDQLRFQLGFYRGAVSLKHHVLRHNMNWCIPYVTEEDSFRFRDLKEVIMGIEQRTEVVGNTCEFNGKDLLIVTGANQGGKSTFLRSIGIAQVMMQCGLFVVAESYAGKLYPGLFTHFTRREDSAMNSGRLDEELKRMSQIVDQVKPGDLVMLNESFASTTEKEGSVIAYDIIKALTEAGVKILTVTHLLSFAKRVYEETYGDRVGADYNSSVAVGEAGLEEGAVEGEQSVDKLTEEEQTVVLDASGVQACADTSEMNACADVSEMKACVNAQKVEFLCAERLENGKRTFKMIQHAPELTSFGLDLYDEMISNKDGK